MAETGRQRVPEAFSPGTDRRSTAPRPSSDATTMVKVPRLFIPRLIDTLCYTA